MISELFKFPSTPHLAWFGSEPVRGDKVMTSREATHFLSRPIVVEEKLDGANLGISLNIAGQLQFQNRGNWLEGKLDGQWARLRSWADAHEARLRSALPAGSVLFGEWCYAKHSIQYDWLPDWFLVFDIFDSAERKFWSTTRRDKLAASAGLSTAPRIALGEFCMAEIQALLDGKSAFYDGPREGIYLRSESDRWLISRAKVVRPGFTQAITEHWTRNTPVANRVLTSVAPCISNY